ncbi:MAG: CPBP family intramembrane metalloprotease [Planctomycetota bacterium]|nr:MAG: CPBP family intramembrane metalloprotease [Planctomycetota bacterium]
MDEKLSRTEYLERTKDFWNSMLLVLPVMFFYQVSILAVANETNGVDFIWIIIVKLSEGPYKEYAIWVYLGFTGAIMLLMIVLSIVFRHKERFSWNYVLPLVGECTLYAIILGVVAVVVTRWVIEANPEMTVSPAEIGPFSILVISAGAGVYEEIVFRLVLFGGFLRIMKKGFEIPEVPAVVAAVVVSAALFSLAHYLGPEPFRLASFTFRFVAGAIFCILYALRGFAAAVYTHTIYDIVVLSLSQGE